MKKHKENLFLEKFSILNSQEHTEDIKWSSSSSSDYENTSGTDKLLNVDKTCNLKRKRKKKNPKNLSNLQITIIDGSKDHKKDVHREKSPILVKKCVKSHKSPILASSTRFPPNEPNSPILYHKSLHEKSPILMLKSTSPKYSIKVRKKLAYNEQQIIEHNTYEQHTERILHSNDYGLESNVENNQNLLSIKKEIQSNDMSLEIERTEHKSVLLNSIKTSDESESSQKAKLNLMNKVKNYFDSHFSSENTSQNISDTPTPEECIKTEAIEILSCKTQTISSLHPSKHESTSNSDSSNYFEKNKKVKYKKGGLAYRLNMLLKKKNAHISLWQHERFLAGTSNFVIPNGEHVVFCIQKIDFRYGCYLLEAVDVKKLKYLIFINGLYVNNNITDESIFKLYEPYRILEFDRDYKIIVNVCKFECIDLNK